MRRQVAYVVGIVALAVAGIVYTVVSGNEPLLGLDLQGGASVVLQPTEPATDEQLDQAVEIIRNRVDGLGVAEPEITTQGGNILVQLPGVDDQQRALELVGQTAELRFRPVEESLDTVSLAVIESVADGTAEQTEDESDEDYRARVEGATGELARWELTPGVEADEPAVFDVAGPDGEPIERLRMGPAPLTGEALQTADARFDVATGWTVNIEFRSGSPGIDDFNELAAQCFARGPGCESGRAAIEIDGVVASAPNVNAAAFERDQVQISGAFSEDEARDLALVLRYGSLPVELEAQASRVVSSTLGDDALDAGIIAGLIGLALVSLYLLAYYRLLGLVAIMSLAISGALLWTIIAWLGETQGLALTLAGVTGLIVSIGVSVDSNVVYFEHLKEDVRGGRTLRSAVDRAFPIAYSTIVKADVASLIAAVVLYFLTVGQVRGFALYLGLATVLDLVATYFFMGPAIRLLAARSGLYEHPTRFGIPVPSDQGGDR